MATRTRIKQDPEEWVTNGTHEGYVEETVSSNQVSYIAVQPLEEIVQPQEQQYEQTVEVQDCQEVVLVAEGSEMVQDVAETVNLGETQMVPVGSEEVYEEAFVEMSDIKEEKPDTMTSYRSYNSPGRYSMPSKLQMHLDAAATPQSSWTSVDFSRPSFTSPQKYYGSGHYRPGAGKSLAKMRRVEGRDTSDTDSDSEYIPDSMLRHKTPKRREFAHRLQWRNRDMLEAMKAVEEQKQTIRGAAKKFNVPYSTLKDRVHGRVRHGSKPGVKTILSPEEEEELAKFVRDMENAGFQLRCVDVRDRAAELLRLNHGHNSPYKDGSPGHNWFHGFVKRHPGLEFKRTVKRNIVPSITKQKHMLRRFYDISAAILKKNKLSHKGDRIYSVSELRIVGQFEVTILYATSADGQLIPPFVIFRGSNVKLNAARQEYPDAFFTCSYDGRVNEDIFLWWFRDHFLKKVLSSQGKPGVCYISRGVTDITMQLVQLAKDERMHLIGMAFGISHLVQPLDDDVSDMIRNAFNRRFKKWQDENPGLSVSQKVVAAVLHKVWTKINPEEIAAKFTANGIFPLNAYAITQDKLLTGAHILREMVERSPPRPEPVSHHRHRYRQQQQQAQKEQSLAGLNLLSTLSTQEYASLDGGGNGSQANHSFESQSDTSFYDGLGVEQTPGYKIMFKSQPGKENEVVVVPLNETSESGVVEQVEIQSSENLETEVVDGEVPVINEQLAELMARQCEYQSSSRRPPRGGIDLLQRATYLAELMARQREYQSSSRRPPRGGIDLLQRATDVRSELESSRQNAQINKAVDSILGGVGEQEEEIDQNKVKTEPGSPSTRSMSPAEPSAAEPPQPAAKRGRPKSIKDSVLGGLRIAPDRIKEEISRAIQSDSFNKTNTLTLSDFHGNDIKIQIRIKNPDELRELSKLTSAAAAAQQRGAGGGAEKSPGSTLQKVGSVATTTASPGSNPTPTTNAAAPKSASALLAAHPEKLRALHQGTGPRTIRLQGAGGGVVGGQGAAGGKFIQVAGPSGSSSGAGILGSPGRKIVMVGPPRCSVGSTSSSTPSSSSSPLATVAKSTIITTSEATAVITTGADLADLSSGPEAPPTSTVGPASSSSFKPIMKVEKVAESLPSQFFEDDDDQQQQQQSVVTTEDQGELETMATAVEGEEEVVEEVTSQDDLMQSGDVSGTNETEVVLEEGAGGDGELIEEAQVEAASEGQYVVASGGDEPRVGRDGEGGDVEGGEEVVGEEMVEDCTVEYLNEEGQVIGVQHVQQ